MRLLLAIGNDDFSSIVRMHFSVAGFEVLDNDVYHRNFLPELLDIERPDIIVLHDVFLPSDTVTAEENELELLELISSWRVRFDDSLRVVVLSERHRQDAFLRSLVAHNVLDIFSERQITVSLLIEQLSEPPRFANVARFGVGHLAEPLFVEEERADEESGGIVEELQPKGTRSLLNRFQTAAKHIHSSLKKKSADEIWEDETPESNVEPVEDTESIIKELNYEGEDAGIVTVEHPSRIGRRTRGRGKKERAAYGDGNELISLPTTIYRDRLIGTALIAVTSIGPNVGATHTSIQLASYLKRKGNTVAFVEASTSGDFERIRELLDESEQQMVTPFYIEDIPHYPYKGEGENIIPFLSQYQFIVLDLGAYEKTPMFTEFFRSQKRIVVASGADWKLSKIGDFIKKHGKVPFHVAIPMASNDLINDLEEIYGGDTTFSSLPLHHNPYKAQVETDAVFDNLYSEFQAEKVTTSNPAVMKVWVTIASTIAVCSVLAMTYMYFK